MVRHITTPSQFLKAAIYSAENFKGMGGRSARYRVRHAIDGQIAGRLDLPEAMEQVFSTLMTTDPRGRLRLSGRLRGTIRLVLDA